MVNTGSEPRHTASELVNTGSKPRHTSSELRNTSSKPWHTSSEGINTSSKSRHTSSELRNIGSELVFIVIQGNQRGFWFWCVSSTLKGSLGLGCWWFASSTGFTRGYWEVGPLSGSVFWASNYHGILDGEAVEPWIAPGEIGGKEYVNGDNNSGGVEHGRIGFQIPENKRV